MSIIAYPLEATEYTAEDVQSYLSTRTSGVYSEDITFTPEGMTVTISPFLAWFNYAKFKGCSVAVTEPEILTFSPANAVLDRIDRVVLRVDFTLNKAYFEVLEGIPSSIPIAKAISKTETINDISPLYVRIRAGATQIRPADITSTILDESLCGIMRDGVTGIPTAQLQTQVEELLLRLHEAIDGVEDGSAFMFKEVYDPEGRNQPVAFAEDIPKEPDDVGLVVEDVSNKFSIPSDAATISKSEVYKYGKVVTGSLSLENFNAVNNLFVIFIANDIKPAHGTVGTVVALNENFEVVEGGYCVIGYNGIGVSQFDPNTETMFIGFTYICE